MEWILEQNERQYLRELARKQAEIAALPLMEERKKMWYDLNDGKAGAKPPCVIETWTFARDFLPDDIFRCSSETGKSIETKLLSNIRNHQLINDDKVIPDTFDINWFVDIDNFGVSIDKHRVKDSQGYEVGFEVTHPIKDLKEDFHLLKPATCSVNRSKTQDWKAFLDDLLGDLLPVKIRTGTFGSTHLTHLVVDLMGMQNFFMAMFDQPDEMHQLMSFLRDNALRVMHWAEEEQLLRINNHNQDSFGSSYNFTTQLSAESDEVPVALNQMFGACNSQETVGVSPDMYHEFCYPYYRDVAEPMGLLYYGCCEPAHPFWEDIKRLPHLKKVSISPWCDEKFMGEALQGTDTVYSRKPDPNFLSVDKKLNEEGWTAHIGETLQATKGCFLEFIIRDVYTLHGDINNGRRAVEICKEEIDKIYS